MSQLRTKLKRLLLAVAVTASVGALGVACGGGDRSGQGAEVDFHGTSELLPNLDYATGLLPAGSPVQASFSLSASGHATLDAAAEASGSASQPTLTGLPGRGDLEISGAFALTGALKVDISGLPSYDGPIPGVDDISIKIDGKKTFDPFAIGKPVTARAEIPTTTLPKIPLPGGLPGDLVLEVVAGSFVELTFTGACAGADPTTATYSGSIARAGTLVIQPSIEIDVPIVGKQSYPIPKFSVDLALGQSPIDMTAKIGALGDKPASGDSVMGSCEPAGTGGGAPGAGGGGQGGAGAAGGGTGGGGSTGGFCDSGSTAGDPIVDACLDERCCDAFATCSENGADVPGCIDCLNAGGGARCDAFLACAAPCEGEICDSGLAMSDAIDYTDCLSANCCSEFEYCTDFGADPDACIACEEAGGGELCDAELNCATTYCGG
jgi:hypothetical protein